ncbi:hypothetical protein Agub_g15812 [Astrephomene gubernaculifera]|uniref:Uncharacterized protein n=1 Tax=Astrephomene gubernaculifera TaxID=47775 RepID=A0AAD3E7B3_9CHLO|nr:hypothetical protein Agub_g15812 [Astrephomene gubernaculifera]
MDCLPTSFEVCVTRSRKAAVNAQDRLNDYIKAKSLVCVELYRTAVFISSQRRGTTLQFEGWQADVPGNASPSTLYNLKFKKKGFEECSLVELLGSQISNLDSFRSVLHKGADVFVQKCLEDKGIYSPSAQLNYVTYLAEVTRPRGHEIGTAGGYFWLQKPWLKKKKELENAFAAGSQTAQAVSSVQNRRFIPTASRTLQAQTGLGSLGGASSSMHVAAAAPSTRLVPWQASGHNTLASEASPSQRTAGLSSCTSPVLLSEEAQGSAEGDWGADLQGQRLMSLFEMEPDEERLGDREASPLTRSPSWEASPRADGLLSGSPQGGAGNSTARSPRSEASPRAGGLLSGRSQGGAGNSSARSPRSEASPRANGLLSGSPQGGAGNSTARSPRSEAPPRADGLLSGSPQGGAGNSSARSPRSEASPRADGLLSGRSQGSAGNSSARSPRSEHQQAPPRADGLLSGRSQGGAGNSSARSPRSEASPRADGLLSGSPQGGAGNSSARSPRSEASPRSAAAFGGCKRPVPMLSLGTEHKLQGGGLRYHGGRPHNKKAKRQCVPAKGPSVDTAMEEALDEVEEITTISKLVFTVDSPAAVPKAINDSGVAILHDSDICKTVTPEAVERALQHGRKSEAIFQGIAQKRNGEFVPERDHKGKPTGYLMSTYGSRQRQQCPIDPDNPDDADVLADFRGLVEPKIKEAMAGMGDANLKLYPPSILLNTQSERQKPVARQGNHTDLAKGQKGGVVIAAVQKMRLLLYPDSNRVLARYWQLEELVDSGVITEEDLLAWVQMRKFKAVRVELDAGDIIFLDGHTVHAGDCGMDDYPSLRLHWYFLDGQKENETTHLIVYGDAFAAQFG